jgi:hypothetical protein
MNPKTILLLFILSIRLSVIAQDNTAYLKANAVRVDLSENLDDSIYSLLRPFQVIMIGEMHGTNEPSQLVTALAKLFTLKGDSVSVGLEIPSGAMTNFISSNTDSSIYQSNFFDDYYFQDGRQSFAWAGIISHLKNNKKVQLFFYDINTETEKKYDRDSLMYLNIKKQILSHPGWKVITIGGDYHAKISSIEKKTAWYLKNDKDLHISEKFCSLRNYYLQGSCRANFGNGLEERKLSRPANEYDSAFSFDKYIILLSAKSTYPYTGLFYTKNITAPEMTKDNLDLTGIKSELKIIYERDQKTRKSSDSVTFIDYIDSCNQVKIKAMIAKYGWMGKSLIGNYNTALFIVIQHADSATQEIYFPLLKQSVEEGESDPAHMALMQDRILMRRGKKQMYGSQIVFDKQGNQVFYSIEDEKNVNARRAKVGLDPIEEYAKNFGIEYKFHGE